MTKDAVDKFSGLLHFLLPEGRSTLLEIIVIHALSRFGLRQASTAPADTSISPHYLFKSFTSRLCKRARVTRGVTAFGAPLRQSVDARDGPLISPFPKVISFNYHPRMDAQYVTNYAANNGPGTSLLAVFTHHRVMLRSGSSWTVVNPTCVDTAEVPRERFFSANQAHKNANELTVGLRGISR